MRQLICMDCTPNKAFDADSPTLIRDAIQHKREHQKNGTFKFGMRRSDKP